MDLAVHRVCEQISGGGLQTRPCCARGVAEAAAGQSARSLATGGCTMSEDKYIGDDEAAFVVIFSKRWMGFGEGLVTRACSR